MKKRYLSLIIVIFIVKLVIIDLYFVDGNSMNPTLTNNEVVIVSKINRSYRIGDIVLIKKDGNKYVKRIAGVNGDKISYNNEMFWINNMNIVRGNYLDDKFNDGYTKILSEKEIFVLGDNIDDSIDSRLFGIITEKNIIGKILGK